MLGQIRRLQERIRRGGVRDPQPAQFLHQTILMRAVIALDPCPWREQSIAPPASGEAQTFRVTHPFHPLRGRTFQLVDCRQTWGEDRVYFHDDAGQLARLPRQWTDVAA